MPSTLRHALRRPTAAVLLGGIAVALAWLGLTLVTGSPRASGATPPAKGYWLGASDGGIFGFGEAKFFGSTGAITLNRPIVGMAASPTGNGYWLVASDGGIFGFGDATFFGSTGALTLNKPIVGMATTPTGKGYWLVASDGGIFGFGDAKFFGSTGALTLNKPIVGMAATPTGKGYWLVASDGGIFGFGDAKFFGSTGAIRLNQPMVAMAASPTGNGYWLVASDGGIFGFGDAKFFGSTGAIRLNQPIVAMAASPTGSGYWLVASDGGIFNFGDAAFFGSTGAIRLNRPIVGLAPAPGALAVDTTAPTVAVNQAVTQADPASTAPVNFTVVFIEAVSSFTASDVVIGGTAGGAKTATVTGTGAVYTVAVSGMTSSGTVTASLPLGAAVDGAGNPSLASTSTDNTVTFDNAAPTVTVNQAAAQSDPTNTNPVNFTVVFSEPVTGFTSADVSLGGTAGGTKTATVTGSGTTYNVAVSGITSDGTVTVSLAAGGAVDGAGNTSAASTSTDGAVTFDATAPTVTGLTSTTADGAYKAGDVITVTVGFSEAVTVTGTPTLALNSGGTATYASGSGTGTLVFSYTVGAGENASDLDQASTSALALAGGTIRDGAGNNAVLTLPTPGAAGSLGADKAIVIDTTAPTVTGVSATTANGAYKAGDVITITVGFSEAVAVTGTPTLALNSGGTATYASGTGTGTLVFSYTVASGQNAGDLDYASTSALALAGGTIRDGAGNNAVLTLPTPGGAGSLGANKAIVIDTTAPTVTGVTSPTANGVYAAGASISVAVTFTEAVTVTGTPTLALSSGGTASYSSGSGTSTLTFAYTVASGHNSADLDYSSISALALSGGSVADATGNNAVLTLPTPGGAGSLGANKDIVIDTAAPTFDSIEATMASTTVTATFSEPLLCTSVSAADFLATVAGNPVAVNGAACTGPSDSVIDLTLNSAPLGGATVVVALVDTSGSVTDPAGNAAATVQHSTAASTDVTVTINQAAGQADPDNTGPIDFTVVFSESVTGFSDADVVLSGTAGGTKTVIVTGSGTTYNVAVSGMTTSGTVIASVAAGAAVDGDGNASAASTSTDNTVTWDVVAPTVTVSDAGGQADPTNTAPINFTVVFSEPVTGFTDGDVTLGGSAGGSLDPDVTGSGTTYNVAVSGMTTSGTVTATLSGGVVNDAAGNGNTASNTGSVTWDVTAPTVTINQAGGQADPTNTSPINFTVVFSEPVTGFTDADVTLSGSAGGTLDPEVTGSGTTYNVAVSGMAGDGTVIATVNLGAATDAAGNTSAASTSTDNTVTWDTTAPTVTVNQKNDQADPTNTGPVNFTVVFSEATTNFADADVTITGTAGGTKSAVVTGSGTTYNVAVSGMTTPGTVIVSLSAGVATDAAGNGNLASTSTDNSVLYDATAPTVTVAKAGGQADPTNTSPINFTVVFSEPVTDFADGDVTLGGTAGGTLDADVTGSGTTYNVAVTGMTTPGTVTVSIGGGAAFDVASNGNTASNTGTVNWDAAAPTLAHIEMTHGSTAVVAVFSEPILCSSVGAGDFPSAIDGSPVAVTTATCDGTSDASIDLVLASAVAEGDVLAVSVTGGSSTDTAGNGVVGGTRTAATLTLSAGSTANGATVDPGDALYEVTATAAGSGTIADLEVLLDGSEPLFVPPSCQDIGTGTATCTYDANPLEPLPGSHTFTFIATDDQGNVTTTTRTVTVDAI